MTTTLHKTLAMSLVTCCMILSFATFAHADNDHERGYCHNPGRHLGWDGAKWHFMFHFCHCY